MFAVNFLENARNDNAIHGERVYLRHPVFADHAQWAELRACSRDFLQPWEPIWNRNELGRYAFRERIKRYNRDLKRGETMPWFIFEDQTDDLLGGITLGHIRRGVSQSAQIGYWMGKPHAGKGFMSEALRLVVHHGFTRCGLHRIEAACIPGNARSIALLERAGFVAEGMLKSYLRINGHWADHILYARINPNSD